MNGRASKLCSWRDPERESIKCRNLAEISPTGEDFRCQEHWRVPWRGAGERQRQTKPLTEREKNFIREQYGFLCAACGAENSREVDHIVEVADGGTNLPSNLQILCADCHAVKTQQARRARQAQVRPEKISARGEAKRRRRRMGLYQQ
jgi:5-methylcytosine-specific restriction endonuclease McrA